MISFFYFVPDPKLLLKKSVKQKIKNMMALESFFQEASLFTCIKYKSTYERHYEKTCLRGFRPGPIQTGLFSHRRWLGA